MPQFTQKKCPTCGGRLELITGNKYECRCCHNVYEMTEGNASLYDALQTASTFRESLNFKQAEMLYKNMLKKYADDDLSDVYWNLLLCEQRVMFETDQYGEQFPSFYDIVSTDIDDSDYYAKAMEYAQDYDTQKLMSFMNLANKMKEAKNKYRTIKNTTKPYDIFICFKKSGIQDPTKLTKDYQLAIDLYNNLSKEYRVFFSERSLNNIVVREYEPNIYHALYTAKIMLVICSNINYLESQWVRNEWSRFKMMSNTTAQAKSIIPIFRNDFQPEQLPYELRNCQGIAADTSMMLNITNAVKEILRPVDKQAELAAKLKAEMEAKMQEQMQIQMKAQMEAFAKQFAEQNKPQIQKPDQTQATVDQPKLTTQQTVEKPQPSATQSKPKETDYIVPYGTTEIKEDQFKYNKDLTHAIIPDTVTTIGKFAFYDCKNLTSVVIPDSVTSIDWYAFYGCTNLTDITFPNSIKEFGCYVFEDTTWYNNQPDGLVYIGNLAYKYKGEMPENTSIRIKEGTTIICDGAFAECGNLANVFLPDGIKLIGYEAFKECNSLTKIEFPNSLTKIDESAFESCNGLTNIIIPSNAVMIDSYAFSCCNRLSSIIVEQGNPKYHSENNCIIETESKTLVIGCNNSVIPSNNSVINIGEWAFNSCEELTNITIPQNIIHIGEGAFSSCIELSSITVEQGNPNYHSINNCLIETESKTLIAGCKTSVIPQDGSVTSIGNSAFYWCSELTEITIPNSINTIGEYAFNACKQLTSIIIPSSVVSIEQYAFNCCEKLTDIKISIGVKSIGEDAFSYCENLKNIIIPSSVTDIGSYAFNECKNLNNITIPNSVTSIGENVFCDCKELSNITFIGTKQQWDTIVSKVQELGIPNKCNIQYAYQMQYGKTLLSPKLYMNRNDITTVKIPNGVEGIGCSTYQYCQELTTVTIHGNVAIIDDYAFMGCTKLTSIIFEGTKKQWKKMSKGKKWDKDTGNYTIHCTDGDLKK